MSFTMSAFLITWLAIALLAFAMSGLVRQVHALASSQQAVPFRTGPPIGAVLPDLIGRSCSIVSGFRQSPTRS
jgi:hypothetical protein